MTPLPEPVHSALAPLFDALPPASAMASLVATQPPDHALVRLVREVLATPIFTASPALEAGLWLYIDDLDRSHAVSQQLHDRTGSWWHAIMHRREGDYMNSQYWYRKAAGHPAMALLGEFDGSAFAAAVSEGRRRNPAALVATQRTEWQTLFSWCAREESARTDA